MLRWLKLTHHEHSGQLKPHEHTSYLSLAVLLLIVGSILMVYSVSAAPPPPAEGSVALTGTVPGPPPATAAVITTPKDQQHFNSSPITVAGTCQGNVVVEIFKNDIFAGSVACTSNSFSLEVDLLFGKNILIARVYDALNQPGPDSAPVTVYFDILPPTAGPLTGFDFGGAQLLLNTDAVYRGLFPEKEFSVPIDILGGTPPYALNVQWGDTNNKVVPRPDNESFRVNHTYQKPGTYQISLQATDSVGRVAFLGVAAIVNGQPSVLTGDTSSTPAPNQLLMLWPVYTAVIGIVIAFWLGERREKKLLSKQITPPLLPMQS